MKPIWKLAGLGTASLLGVFGAHLGLKKSRAQRRLRLQKRIASNEQLAPHRIVILGAGFAGFTAAKKLNKLALGKPVEILLIDRNNYHLFTPMLHQVAAGQVEPEHIGLPLRSQASGIDRTQFRQCAVKNIDLAHRHINTESGDITYDTLVIALGSVAHFFGQHDTAQQALTLKSLNDGIILRNKLAESFEKAAYTVDKQVKRELLTFHVIGAGSTGVELATSLDEFRRTCSQYYPNIQPHEVFIDLIEAHEHPLSEMSKQTRKRAIKHLERLGIKVLTKTRISGIENGHLRTSEGKLLSPGHFIWTGGVRANPLAETLPVQQGRGGRLKVSPFLNLSSNPEVYCIGDIAETSYRTTAAPPNAPGAIQMGKAAALNITRSLQGLPLKPFKYRNEGELLYLGRNNAVIHIGKLVFDGFIAWLLWHAFYLIELKGLENRTKAAIDWVVEYGSQRRLITQLSFKPMG